VGDAVTITAADGTTAATFLPDANLVCSALTYDGADWLDPVRAEEARASGKDYGISLVYPWAGRLARFGYDAAGRAVTLAADDEQLKLDKQGLPIHGVWDRLLRWQVEHAAGARLVATLAWDEDRLLEVFPFPHRVTITASVGPGRLHQEVEVRPTADVGVPVAFGHHAFLRIPDSGRDDWTLELNATERLVLDASQVPNGTTEPLAERELAVARMGEHDDVGGFASPARMAFTDGRATVALEPDEGYPVAHLFTPPGRDLVSFEPMTAPANALVSGDRLHVVAPGDTFRAAFAIRVSR
jgi:aldose 1-epimerase